MKRIISVMLLSLCLIMPTGCKTVSKDGIDVDVTETLYVSYINDIYTNINSYVGKNIRIEGMFKEEIVGSNSYCYVYRVGPGCCGNDGAMCGFEFTWDGASQLLDNSWIEVVGELETYQENGKTYLNLRASSVTVLTQRGKETVAN